MSSQLNVDTIVDKAGSGGSNVKMANTSTYVSDGGAVTQNTVQGIAKAWVAFTGTGTISTNDSFNTSGVTDNGTGDYTPAWTNAFNGANDYAFGGFAQGDSGGGLRGVCGKGTSATGNRQVDVSNSGGSAIDVAQVQVIAQGDLA